MEEKMPEGEKKKKTKIILFLIYAVGYWVYVISHLVSIISKGGLKGLLDYVLSGGLFIFLMKAAFYPIALIISLF
jgi:hypothetical protein